MSDCTNEKLKRHPIRDGKLNIQGQNFKVKVKTDLHGATLSVPEQRAQPIRCQLIREHLPEVHVTLAIRHNRAEVVRMECTTHNDVTKFLSNDDHDIIFYAHLPVIAKLQYS